MGKPDHRENVRTKSRCAPDRRKFSVSGRQVLFAIGGAALLLAGIVIAEQTLPIGPILILLGALVLLVGVALPQVHRVTLGAPWLLTVTIAAEEQRVRLHTAVEDCRGILVACAGNLCPDADAASRAVEASVSKGLGDWHGSDTERLRGFLLCLLVHEARFETVTHPLATSAADPFLQLPLGEREVLVLLDRAGLDRPTVARMLGLAEDQVESLRGHALAAVGIPMSSS